MSRGGVTSESASRSESGSFGFVSPGSRFSGCDDREAIACGAGAGRLMPRAVVIGLTTRSSRDEGFGFETGGIGAFVVDEGRLPLDGVAERSSS
jgi:hypothetical protein